MQPNPFCFPSAELVIRNHIPERLFDLSLTTFCDGDVNAPKTFPTLTVCKVFLRAQSCLLQLCPSPFSDISHGEQTIPSCSAADKECQTSLSAVSFLAQTPLFIEFIPIHSLFCPTLCRAFTELVTLHHAIGQLLVSISFKYLEFVLKIEINLNPVP